AWPPSDLAGLNTSVAVAGAGCLLIAGLMLALTVRAQHQNTLGRFRFWLAAALIFLAAFLALNITEWRAFLMMAQPVHAVFGGIFIGVTGLFHLHVAVAFVYIV